MIKKTFIAVNLVVLCFNGTMHAWSLLQWLTPTRSRWYYQSTSDDMDMRITQMHQKELAHELRLRSCLGSYIKDSMIPLKLEILNKSSEPLILQSHLISLPYSTKNNIYQYIAINLSSQRNAYFKILSGITMVGMIMLSCLISAVALVLIAPFLKFLLLPFIGFFTYIGGALPFFPLMGLMALTTCSAAIEYLSYKLLTVHFCPKTLFLQDEDAEIILPQKHYTNYLFVEKNCFTPDYTLTLQRGISNGLLQIVPVAMKQVAF